MTGKGSELSRFQGLIETLRTPVLVRWAAGALVCALTLVTGTCRVGDLTNPPPPLGKLAVSPAAVVDSAAVGSAARRSWTVAISNAGQGVLSWTAHADGSAWVVVSPMSGTAPGTVTIVLDPATLGMGVYRDTVMLSADGAANSPVPLAIELHVRPCATVAVAPDVEVSDSLRTSDCSAPHRAGHFAQLYSFDGAPGDSITIALASPAFGPYVLLDSSMAATAPPLAEAASCPGQSGACLSYVLLPRAGTYVVEATSVNAGQIGAYLLSVTRPHAPNLSDSLRQLRSDSLTATPVGGTVDQATVVLGGALSDPNAQDTLRLEVEVRPVGTAFTGTATANSARVANGRRALAAVAGLSNNTSYHWQARTVDQTGRRSGWSAFGGNPESAADFTVAIPQPPNAPTGAAQFKADGVTSLVLGGTTDQLSTVFKALVTDPNPPDQLRLDVEVEPVGTAFTNTPSGTGVPAANGGTATATVAGLVDNTAYHWQARTVDQTGLVSPWVSFGGNPEADADFRVAIAPTQLVFTVQPGNTTAGTAITPAVQVTAEDAAGNAVKSFAGNVTIALGTNPGGTLSGTTTVGAVAGVARFSNLSVDKVGAYALQAGAGTLTTTSTPFNVTPGTAVQLAFTVEPGPASAGSAMAPAVRVAALDAQGNIATGFSGSVTVAFGSNPVGGTLSGSVTVAAASGVATFANLIIDKAGAGYTLVAAAAGAGGGGPASATSSLFNVTSGSAAKLVFTVQPGATAAGAAITPAVRVTAQDAQGNTATGFAGAVTLTIGNNPGTGTLSGTASVAAVAGVATFADLSINRAGVSYTLAASATGITGTGSAPFNVTPGVATQLTFSVQPGNTTAGAALTPAVTVTAQDAQGNVATSFTGTVTISLGPNPSGATLAGTLNETAAAGVATFGNLSINKTGTYTLAASASGPTGATSTGFTVAPAQATRLVFTVQPSNATAGSAIAPAVQVTDQDTLGNTVTTFTGSVTMTLGDNSAGGTLSGTLTVTASSGVATFSSLSINKVGAGYTLAATTSGSAAGASAPFNVSPGTATQLAFTAQPSSTTAGAPITPGIQVTAQDAQGNTATSFVAAVTVTIGNNPGSGTLSGTARVTAVGGVATFTDLSINKMGVGYTLDANGTGLPGSGTSTPFTITPAAPSASQSQVAAAPSGIIAGTGSATITVTARDANGNPVSGATVVLAALGSGNTLTQPSGPTNGSGVATGTLSSTVADEKTISATVSGIGITQMAVVTVIPAAWSPSHSEVAAAPASIIAGSGSATITVTVQDGFGNPISGATVVLAATGSGNTLTQPVGLTNASGVTTGTLSSTVAGEKRVSATIAGTSITQMAAVTVTPAAPSATLSQVVGAPTNITASSGGSQSTITVTAKDGLGNPVSGATVVLTATGNGNTLTQPAAVTDANGVATGTISSTLADVKTVSASVNGIAITQMAAVAVTPAAAAQIAKQAGDDQTAAAGTGVPVAPAVLVTDAFGNHVDDVIVTFAVQSGGGSVTGAAPGSNMDGVATVGSWILGTVAGPDTLTATVTGLAGSPLTFTATGAPGSATNLTITTEPAAAAQAGVVLTPQPVVQLRDAYGNLVNQAGLSVTATVGSGGLGGTTTVSTDANGVASFTNLAIAGLAGSYTLDFTSGSLPVAASSPIALSAGPAAQLAKHAGDNQTAPAGTAVAVPPAVLVTDASGNPVAGVLVTFAVTPGVGSVSPTTPVATDASGVAVVTSWTLGTVAGPNSLEATATGLLGVTFSATGSVGGPSGVQSQISASSGTIVASNGANQATITVTVRDANGNPVPGQTVTLAATPATGVTLTQPAGTTDGSGQITGTLSSTKAGPIPISVAATIDGSIPVSAAATVTVTSAPASQLSFIVPPAAATAGQPITPAVQVDALDGFGNVATTFGDAITLTIAPGTGTSGAALHGTPTVSAIAGVATFANLSVDSAGTGYQLTASATGLPGVTSTAFTNVAGPAASLSFTGQPSNIAAGALMTPGVQIIAHDAVGNKATSFNGTISVGLDPNPNSGKLYGKTKQSAVAGVALFPDLTVDSAAAGYALRATAGSLVETSSSFSVAAAPSAVFVGAGDIANSTCASGGQGQTAALLRANPLATVFTAGDNAYPDGTLAQYQACYDLSWGLEKARTWPVVGNHEYTTPGAPGYWQYFTEYSPTVAVGDSGSFWYSHDLGAWHVIALNSEVSYQAGSPQEVWLRADLAKSTKQCTLAYWHRPYYSAGSTHASATWLRPLWLDLYNAGAEIVVSGHEHNYERFAPQAADSVLDLARGIREFVVGTGGGTIPYVDETPKANLEVFNATVAGIGTWGILKLTLYATTYTWEFVPVAGGSFTDQGSGSCH